MGRADPRRGQDRSPTISVSLTMANSPQTVTSGEGQAAGARCWRLTCSRTLPGAKEIVFCKRWRGTSGRCPLLRGCLLTPGGLQGSRNVRYIGSCTLSLPADGEGPPRPRRSPEPQSAKEEPRAPICSPRLRTAAKRRRQTAGAPGSRSVRQSVSCKSLLTAEIGAGLRTSRRLRSAGFQPPGRIWGRLLARGWETLWKTWPP